MAVIAPNDFFAHSEGNICPARWRRYSKILRLVDAAADARVALPRRWALKAARRMPRHSVLLAAVEVPGRESDLARVIERVSHTRQHEVNVAITRMRPVGKFENINHAIAGYDLPKYDWLLIVDDDIQLPDNFLDLLLFFSHSNGLKLSQPAHKFLSYSTYKITERHWGSQARSAGFVEIGPVSLLHSDTFADLIPFPPLRWCWGLDVFWAQVARRRGWRTGVIDTVPIRHLRPIGTSYDTRAALDEAVAFMTSQRVTINRSEIFGLNRRIS